MALTALVTAATGRQGGATARSLISANVDVRVLVRDPTSPAAVELERLGAKPFKGDFEDPESLVEATRGAHAVFLNTSFVWTNPDPDTEFHHAQNVIQAAKQSGSVTRIVYSSVYKVGKHESYSNWDQFLLQHYWSSKEKIEKAVRNSGIEYWTILQPSGFMTNYVFDVVNQQWPELAQKHVIRAAYDSGTICHLIDPDDIGVLAAETIQHPQQYHGSVVELSGDGLTTEQIAETISQASGKRILVEYIPKDQALEEMKSNPVIGVQLFFDDMHQRGELIAPDAAKRYPIKLTTFKEFLLKRKDLLDAAFN